MRPAMIVRLSLFLLLTCIVVGCRGPKILVYPPIHDTAKAQYDEAILFRESHQLELIDRFDNSRRKNAYLATRQMFEKVIPSGI